MALHTTSLLPVPLLLEPPIGAKGATKQKNVSEQRNAMGLRLEGVLVLGGKGAPARQEQRTVVGSEVVVEFRRETQIKESGGGGGADLDREEIGIFGLPFDVDVSAPGHFLQHPFEVGEGDVGQARKIFVADGAAGFVCGMSQTPEPEVHDSPAGDLSARWSYTTPGARSARRIG